MIATLDQGELLLELHSPAGRLRWIHGGRLELHCNAKGAQLLEAYSEVKLDELGGLCTNKGSRRLVPKVDYGSPIEDWSLMLVQVTRFSCGGLCVGTAMSHTVVDGWSVAKFFNAWTKLARGDELEANEMPFHDRTILLSPEPLLPPRFEHIEKKANEIPHQDMEMVVDTTYSRYEAVASHLWRCICKARASDNSQPTRVSVAVDIRSRLNPSLPAGYFGNATLLTVTSNGYAAGKLREAIERMTNEYVRSALDFIAGQDDVSTLRGGFHIRAYTKTPNFLGNPNVSIGSWINFPFYGMDYGWGKPIYIGPGLLNDDGKSFIMSSPTADGSLLIALKIFYESIDIDFIKAISKI
ncbi:hypothetical protein I3843_10G131900 [Carya illinoinensis]|nr:hypothetical protein I3843_10G131900 [Carya illinoinensis]